MPGRCPQPDRSRRCEAVCCTVLCVRMQFQACPARGERTRDCPKGPSVCDIRFRWQSREGRCPPSLPSA
eukprot:15474465-Alexandrium_andersonii.AAC.1